MSAGAAMKRESRLLFWEKDSPELYYVMGLVAADGCIHPPSKISIELNDYELLEAIHSIVGGCLYYRKTRRGAVWTFQSKEVVDRLSTYGIGPRKSLSLRFPERIPSHYIRDFLRGYSDGDGHISDYLKTRCSTWGLVGTMEFLNVAKELIFTLVSPSLNPRMRKSSRSEIWNLEYSVRADSQCVLHWLYDGASKLCLSRKKERAAVIMDLPFISAMPKSAWSKEDDKEIEMIASRCLKMFPCKKPGVIARRIARAIAAQAKKDGTCGG